MLPLHLITNTSTFGHCSPPITVPSVIGCFALTGVPSSWVCETTWPSRSERNPHGLLITLCTSRVPSGSIFLGGCLIFPTMQSCAGYICWASLHCCARRENHTTVHRPQGGRPTPHRRLLRTISKKTSKDWATNTEMCCPAFLRSLRSAGLVLWTRFSW